MSIPILGLDLGKTTDPSAFVAGFQTHKPDPLNNGELAGYYDIRNIHRWPLGTKYQTVVAELKEAVSNPALEGAVLVIDYTGAGKAVFEIFQLAGFPIPIYGITITAGTKVTFHEVEGDWHVAKRELVSTLLRTFQWERIRIAKAVVETKQGPMDFAELLTNELNNFKLKLSNAANETFGNWREGEHDDLVLALALCVWGGENLAAGAFEPGIGSPVSPGLPSDLFLQRPTHDPKEGGGRVVHDPGNRWPW